MQGDFSRLTFDPARHFSAVLTQQGRVQLDADANEQAAILLHQLRTAIADLVGPAGVPAAAEGSFAITALPGDGGAIEDLGIGAGRIYVNGVLVENAAPTSYFTQPDARFDPDDADHQLPPAAPYVVYLRAWERLVTAAVDPHIREVALGDGGPDTAARAQVAWQVAVREVKASNAADAVTEFTGWLATTEPTGRLRAAADQPEDAADTPCHLPPESRYRGQENQLYRVEVHTGGQAWAGDGPASPAARRRGQAADPAAGGRPGGATFKWSRENASVVFPIVSASGRTLELATLGRDGKLGLQAGDVVEVVEHDDPHAPAPPLRTVVDIDPADRRVTLDGDVGEDCATAPGALLRRWDHPPRATVGDGALPVSEGRWLNLEDGVRVWFEPPSGETPGVYRRGDYWLIPARTVTGDVLWPQDEGGARAEPPHGVRYHHAPLAYVSGGTVDRSPLAVFGPLTASGQARDAHGPAAPEQAAKATRPPKARRPATPPSRPLDG